ncbi:MAG: trypsin-like peptidase domain-containing protein [Nanoarchaeota archaeon]
MGMPWEDAGTFAKHHILLMFAFSLIVSGSILVYLYSDLNMFKASTTQQLGHMEASFQVKFDLLQNETRSSQEALEYREESKDKVVEEALRGIRNEYQTRMQTLLKTVTEIEKKSNVQLDDLKKQLESTSGLPKDFSDVVEKALNSIVSVTTNKALGSGAIIGANGFIVTNNHVIDGAKSVSITLRSGKVYPATIIYKKAEHDLAFLKIQESNLPVLRFTNSDQLKAGEKVVALGNPAGLQFSATEGIISAIHRNVGVFLDVVQVDVSIGQGSSGGPLINKYGEIIGITSFRIKGNDDLGFAIPSNTVKQAFDGLGK